MGWVTWIERAHRWREPLARTMGLVGGLVVVALMVLITLDALGRKFLQSVPGALEFSEAAMVGIVFLPLMYVQMRREHVFVTIATQRFPLRVQALLDALIALLAMVMFCWFTMLTARKAYQAYLIREFRAGMILFPIWPFRWLIPIGTGFMALELLLTALEELQNVARPERKRRRAVELGGDVTEVSPEIDRTL